MKKRYFSLVLMLFLFTILLVGCTDPGDYIVGRWKGDNQPGLTYQIFEFRKDRTLKVYRYNTANDELTSTFNYIWAYDEASDSYTIAKEEQPTVTYAITFIDNERTEFKRESDSTIYSRVEESSN